MKEVIIKKNDKEVTLMDKQDIMNAINTSSIQVVDSVNNINNDGIYLVPYTKPHIWYENDALYGEDINFNNSSVLYWGKVTGDSYIVYGKIDGYIQDSLIKELNEESENYNYFIVRIISHPELMPNDFSNGVPIEEFDGYYSIYDLTEEHNYECYIEEDTVYKLYIQKNNELIILLNEQTIDDKISAIDLADYIKKSLTTGLLRNDGTVDTNTYLTQHDISGKANISDLSTVAISGDYEDLLNKPTIPSFESPYEITTNKGSASSDTMNKFFIEIRNNKRDVYYTIKEEEGYVYFDEVNGQIKLFAEFSDFNKYYYLLSEDEGSKKIAKSFEYNNEQNVWIISDVTYGYFDIYYIAISDTEFDEGITYITNEDCFISEQFKLYDDDDEYTTFSISNYTWHKLDSDILDSLSINWSDIENKPSIPTKISDLTNDSGFFNISDLATVATSGSYNDLIDKPNTETIDILVTYANGRTEILTLLKQN